ncbi:E3 ubiquitin-protein ligase RNF183 [Pangasianodon hypophthalmus]|uniref:E3 ubiquitin-protein ligase RNF183 n=1 Tax=Pangasianodon hypophthalmus TaxID=310915 RepID=UPI000EFFF060|nr:E3 ubiquitin-protein ligase RNF183 [Pangasianodon hypophthalmus]
MTDNQASEAGGQEKFKPNVKPQYDQKDSNQQGALEKREKCEIPHRRSRSSDSERRGRQREREQEHRGRRERGRSEEARRGSKRSSNGRGITNYPRDNLDETECPICFCNYDNVFKTPKLLSCGHTFCLECLARINVSSMEIKKLSCPVCRELTEIRHGRDLPQLGNNENVFRKLPPQMQKAQSVRFERSKGKLVLKNAPLTGCFSKKTTVLPVGAIEEGLASTTIVNVGRPPNRVRGRMGRVFQSNNCYYTVVVSIIVIAVALVIVGILTFVVMPNVILGKRPPHGDNVEYNMTNG